MEEELSRMEEGRREGEGQSVNVVTLERFWDYSMCILKMAGGAILFFHASSIDFFVCLGLLDFTFIADSALWLLTFFLKNIAFNERGYTAAKTLIYTTTLLMMLTSASLLLLLNLSYAMVLLLVLPLLMIVIIVFYNGINADQARELTDYGTLQPELKQFFDLSASVTVAAFTAMIATIFNYFKNLPKDDDHEVDVKFSEIFIFFTVNFGLLMMLFTTVPPSLPHPNARQRYITFIRCLSYSLFVLLALTGLAVAAEFLGYLNLLAFLPIFLAIVVWLKKEFIQENGTSQAQSATGHESKPDASSVTITTCILAVLIAVDTFLGSEDNDFYFMTCMFLLSLAFMSSLSWMILTFICPTTQSLAMPVRTLTWSTFFGFVFAIPVLIFLVIRTYFRRRQN